MSGTKMPDYYLNSIKSKIKAEDEKKIRGLSFAKLYYANKDYEKALTFLNEYLSIKNNSSEAYRVLGDVYEALDNNEKSFEAYKKSYFIDKSQDNLLIKICEKLENLNTDTQTIKLWLDRLEKKYPNHQSVFNLKDKLQLENGNNSRLEDTFRDLSNVKLSDLTDDKVANLSCSFLNSKSPSFTSNQFKSLERSQDRLFKKIIEFEENIDKKIDQLTEIIKENHTMFSQLKNEVDKINSTLVKLQLEQDYEDEEYDEDEEDDQDNQINQNAEPKTSNVFSRLGPNMTPTTSTISNPVQISPNVDNTKPLSELYKDQYNNTWECKECYVKNDNKKTLCLACETPNPAQSLPSLPSFSPSKQPAISNSQTFSNKPLQAPVFGCKAPFSTSIPSSGFLFGQTVPLIPASTQTNVFSKLAQTMTPTTTPVQIIDTNVAKDNTKPLSELFKDSYNNTWECKQCYVKNDNKNTICVACEEPNTAQSLPSLPSFSPSKQPATSNIQTINNLPIKPPNALTFGNLPTLPASVFGDKTPSKPTLPAPVFGDKTLFQPATSNIQTINNLPIKPPNTQALSNSTLQAPVFGDKTSFSNTLTNSVFVFGQNIPFIPTKETKTQEIKIKNNAEAEQPTVGDGEDEPQIDFTPVIPLPPKIDVITGEENEKVLFTHRAKLFRFVDQEYKERGLGDIKILFDENNNKYRLLMRRDQILKVCLNSPILANFTFKPLPDNKTGNMLKFGVFDFSEEKSKIEVFLLKFKTKEIADQFKKEVHRIVKTLGGKVLDDEIPLEKAKTINKEEQSKSETELIKSDDIEIVFVKEPKSVEQKEKAEKLKLPINFYHYEDANPCTGCNGCKDFIPKLKYELENKDKENESNENKGENQVIADNNSENFFSFAIATAGTTKSSWTESTEQPNWMKSSVTPIFSSEQSNDQTNDDPEAEVPLEFTPVIPLPPKIDIITGEEDEEVLFSNRAKLYKFNKNEWKERGVGDFKVLRHKQTKKIRFLMRRELVHKICLNHLVDKNLKIGRRPQRDNIYQWSASDFSESTEGEPSLFNIRFKNRDIGIKFMEILNNNIDGFKEEASE